MYCFVHQMSYVITMRETSIEIVDNIENDDFKQLTTSTEMISD